MKSLITLLMLTTTLFAKIDTTQNFFPLAVGNVWQYMYDDGRIETVNVIKDSIDEMGYRYFTTFTNRGFYQHFTLYKVSHQNDSVIVISGGDFLIGWLVYKFPITHQWQWWRVQFDTGKIPITAHVINIFPISFWGKLTTTAADIRYHANMDTTFPTTEWMYTEFIADGIGMYWRGEEVEYKFLIGCVINGDTLGIIVKVEDEKENNPDRFELYQNYPNPFNPSTVISYQLSAVSYVTLKVYDILGREVATLVDEVKESGTYHFPFSIIHYPLPAGVYFYQLRVRNNSSNHLPIQTKKMLIMK
jgi:hypothetical protein